MATATTLRRAIEPKKVSGPAIRAFFKLAERWDLDVEQQLTLLGGPARSTFFKWKKEQTALLSMDTLTRISYLLGIFKALHILLSEETSADSWVKKKNAAPLFNGRTALDFMLSGQMVDLYLVRQYLDGERG